MTTTTPVRSAAVAAAALALAAAGAFATASGPAAVAAEDHPTNELETVLRPSGDPDGTGEATIRLSPAQHRVCARIEWARIDRPDASHIHRRSDGGIVVDLTGAVTGGARCTTGVPRAVIMAIKRHPGRYYVNVHNAAYPAGAIQGTLHR